jgi:hypothetical protein
MKKFLAVLALAIVPALAPAALAAEADQGVERHRPAPTAEQKAQWEARKKEWEAMTPEQRQAKMAEMRAKREANMTPEEKARHEARRKEWEAMTPEQREAKRQEMKQRRGQHGPRGQRK